MSSQARLGRGLGEGLGYISKESRDLDYCRYDTLHSLICNA